MPRKSLPATQVRETAPAPTWRGLARAAKTPRERLEVLIAALRDEEARREVKLEWDFQMVLRGPRSTSFPKSPPRCGSVGCAIGLAAVLWPELHRDILEDGGLGGNLDRVVAQFLGLQYVDVQAGLLSTFAYPAARGDYERVTPRHVADYLERCARGKR